MVKEHTPLLLETPSSVPSNHASQLTATQALGGSNAYHARTLTKNKLFIMKNKTKF